MIVNTNGRFGVRHPGAWALLGLMLLGGCGGQSMALQRQKTSLDTSKKSIALFTLRVSNQFKPTHQAKAFTLFVVPVGDPRKSTEFCLDVSYQRAAEQYYEYLVSIDMEPGAYRIGNVTGAGYDPLVNYTFEFPLGARFDLPPNGVVYLGHVTMTNRERKEGEPPSGSSFSLVSQAVAGYSNGTMDITIVDRADEDLPAFTKAFPVLRGCQIQRAIFRRE